jgi:hypothetical protein
MLQQVALFSSGRYSRKGTISALRIPLPDGRSQTIYGRNERRGRDQIGVLYTKVGMQTDGFDPWELLALNAGLRHCKVAVSRDNSVLLLALFDMERTSIKECAPMLQEMAAVADDLERRVLKIDIS